MIDSTSRASGEKKSDGILGCGFASKLELSVIMNHDASGWSCHVEHSDLDEETTDIPMKGIRVMECVCN